MGGTAGNRQAVLVALISLGVVVLATMVLSASAVAAPSKPYSLVICALPGSETCAPNPTSTAALPAAVPAGAANLAMTATLTNENKPGTGITMGSANLTPPSGFTVTGASISGCATCATVLNSGSLVQLRNLNLPPGPTPLTVNLTVSTPSSGCALPTASTGCAWTTVVKQSNDFNGPPGNDLSYDSGTSAPYAVLTHIQFGAQPHGVAVGSVITDSDYNQPPPNGTGGPVTVRAVDANGNLVASYQGPVSVSLNLPTFAIAPGTLGGTTSRVAVGGVATFGDLTVSAPANGYTLTASTTQLPPPTTSGSFDAAQAATRCDAGKACKQVDANSSLDWMTTNAGIDVKASAGTGSSPATLAVTVDFGSLTPAQCEGYTAAHGAYTNLSSTRTETDTITTTFLAGTIDNTAITGQDMCMASKLPFTMKVEGSPQDSLGPAIPTTLPDGSAGYSGLLADCAPRGKKPKGLQVDPALQPCVASRSGVSQLGGGGTLTITSTSPFDRMISG